MRRAARCALAVLALLACASPSLRQRLMNAEQQSLSAESELEQAEKELEAIEPDAAEAHLKTAREALGHSDVGYYPERQMIQERLARGEKRLEGVRVERARRDLEKKAQATQLEIEPRLKELEEKIQEARLPDPRGGIGGLKGVMGGLFDALAAARGLEDQVAGYSQFARDARRKLDAATKELWLAEARVAFLEGPARSWREARNRLDDARSEKDRRRRRELYSEARTLFQTCAKEGRSALSKSGGIRTAPLVVDETQTTPGMVVDRCVQQDRAIARTLARLRVVARTPAPGKAKSKRP